MADWNHGLCGCFDDFSTCIITYFLPCYTAGKNAEALGKSCILYGILSVIEPIGCVVRSLLRKEIRENHGIDGSLVGDICTHLFCPICGLVQEAQQVKCPPAGGMAR